MCHVTPLVDNVVWYVLNVLIQTEQDDAADSTDEVSLLGRTAPVSYVIVSGKLQQHTAAAHSAPTEPVNSRQQMSSPLSLDDRASIATSISEVTAPTYSVKKKTKKIQFVIEITTLLREITCHMGSHSVTCHPAEVPFPPLPQPKLILDLATPERCKAELT